MTECTIGAGTLVIGRVSGTVPIWVSGRIEGTVALHSEFIVQPDGLVFGDVEADSVIVRGTIEGSVVARDTITLSEGSKVTGEIRAPRIIIEEGAGFDGSVDMDVELPRQKAVSGRS